MSDQGTVNWGFIGAGGLATGTTAKSLHNAHNANLYAAAARDESRALGLSPKIAYDSYEKLIQDPNIDAVYISLNNDAHLPLDSQVPGRRQTCSLRKAHGTQR